MNKAELLEANAHMSTKEVIQDVKDTESEMEALRAMKPGVRVLEDRVLQMRIEVGISQRAKFVAKLKELLAARSDSETYQKERPL